MIEPTQRQLATLMERAAATGDGPKVMLNLNRYRERAYYSEAPPGDLDPSVSGQEAYLRYGAAATTVIARVGGKILWYAPAEWVFVGEERDRFDEVVAVWYPSLDAFRALIGDPDLLAAHVHRAAGLERAAIICCAAGSAPELGLRAAR